MARAGCLFICKVNFTYSNGLNEHQWHIQMFEILSDMSNEVTHS